MVDVGEEQADWAEIVLVLGILGRPVAERDLDRLGGGVLGELVLVHDQILVNELKIPTPIFSPRALVGMIPLIANLQRLWATSGGDACWQNKIGACE